MEIIFRSRRSDPDLVFDFIVFIDVFEMPTIKSNVIPSDLKYYKVEYIISSRNGNLFRPLLIEGSFTKLNLCHTIIPYCKIIIYPRGYSLWKSFEQGGMTSISFCIEVDFIRVKSLKLLTPVTFKSESHSHKRYSGCSTKIAYKRAKHRFARVGLFFVHAEVKENVRKIHTFAFLFISVSNGCFTHFR